MTKCCVSAMFCIERSRSGESNFFHRYSSTKIHKRFLSVLSFSFHSTYPSALTRFCWPAAPKNSGLLCKLGGSQLRQPRPAAAAAADQNIQFSSKSGWWGRWKSKESRGIAVAATASMWCLDVVWGWWENEVVLNVLCHLESLIT